jgi:hypothetical protein
MLLDDDPGDCTVDANSPVVSDLREQLAALAHEQWSGWMRYMFSKAPLNADGSWTMPAWAVERWTRQLNTPYADLSGQEKASDRGEADKVLALIRSMGRA